VALVVSTLVAYSFGGLRHDEARNRQEQDERTVWRCDECQTSAVAPNAECLVTIWDLHDSLSTCPTKWALGTLNEDLSE
jgi:hypothetical protein